MRLSGKVCLITGGGNGIGAATAVQFAREGAVVEIGDVDLAAATSVVSQIEASGGRSTAMHVDVTDEASLIAWVAAVLSRNDKIDVLFNNAGISPHLSKIT